MRYFIRLFKKYYELTPQAYISLYRVHMASNYLSEGMKVSEVAKKVGFLDSKSFSRFFKNQKGISPSEFKKITICSHKEIYSLWLIT